MIGIRGFNVKKCRLCQRERACSVYVKGIGYICDNHFYSAHPYPSRNEEVRGTRKAKDTGDYTWGTELEFRSPSQEDKHIRTAIFARLLLRGFLPTEDATVSDCEMKSPIYLSRRSFTQSLRPIYKDYSDYLKTYLISSHIHVGVSSEEMNKIERAQSYLEDVVINRRLWGRDPNEFANQDDPNERYFFINTLTGDLGTVEFRLPKITTYRQLLVVTLFIKKFIKDPFKFEDIQRRLVRKL